ncbi:hypothetical protein K0M31_002164 [Melipona bicolor]|uniref:Ig-like domain-containing protein n=1 Tax=Melipona bicolor TaxID=60889 RepID=A0AA40GGY4_9HYME|nr:hypothetical protein K0M31_002164 [Melipona bicolor]
METRFFGIAYRKFPKELPVPCDQKLSTYLPLVPLVNISVVEGKPAELPCDITPPGEDTLHMVFWFKNEAGVPLYT